MHSGRGCASLGTWRVKTLFLSYGKAGEKSERLPALADELVRLKVDHHRCGWSDNDALAAKDATATIPIVFMAAVSDPVGAWIGRQPGAARRQHHGIFHHGRRVSGKTTGATEGRLSQALSRRRPGVSDPDGPTEQKWKERQLAARQFGLQL